MATDDLSKSIVNCLFIVDFDTKDSKIVYDLFLDQLTKVFEADNDPKLSSSMIRQFGYSYYLKNQVRPNHIVSIFADLKNNKLIPMEAVRQFISHISCKEMPKNNTALIEFIISEKPIEYEESQTTFAVIFRFSHCIMDGPALLHFLYNNNILSGPKPKQFMTEPPKKLAQDFWSTIFNFTTGSYDFLTVDTFKAKEFNYFHTGALLNQRLVQWITEKNVNIMPKIKEIKKRTGASITNIMTVAAAASLKQFAKRRNRELEKMTTITTFQTQPIDFSQSPKLTNTFAFNIFDYPLNSLTFTKTRLGNLRRFLDDYLQCYAAFQSTNLISIIDTFIKIFGSVIPRAILNLFETKNITFLLTNLGNMETTKFWTYDLKHFLIFSHNDGQLGLVFILGSYQDKLNICLTADQKYLHHVEEADEILEGIFESVNQLLREVLTN